MKGHYLMLLLPEGKNDVRRFYMQLAHEDETLDEAVERYVSDSVAGRKRNIAMARERVRRNILDAKLCRPTSWHRARCAEDGVPFPRPVGRKRRGR